MKGIFTIFLVLFVLSIAKAKPVPEWEDEEEWDEAWKENVDALNEKEDDKPWDEEEDDEAWDEEDSGEEDEAWEGGDNTVLQDDLTGRESGEDNGDKE